MVKLSPNVTDITEIARAVADAGATPCPHQHPAGDAHRRAYRHPF